MHMLRSSLAWIKLYHSPSAHPCTRDKLGSPEATRSAPTAPDETRLNRPRSEPLEAARLHVWSMIRLDCGLSWEKRLDLNHPDVWVPQMVQISRTFHDHSLPTPELGTSGVANVHDINHLLPSISSSGLEDRDPVAGVLQLLCEGGNTELAVLDNWCLTQTTVAHEPLVKRQRRVCFAEVSLRRSTICRELSLLDARLLQRFLILPRLILRGRLARFRVKGKRPPQHCGRPPTVPELSHADSVEQK